MPTPDYPEPVLRRFWEQVEKTESCWLWRGGAGGGYGGFSVKGERIYPHRLAYELIVGPIPTGTEIDHLCRNTLCVNPAHLEAVTHRENILRIPNQPCANNARKTHCKHGHPFAGENLTFGPRGKRLCVACRDRRRAAYNERRREKRRLARV